MCAHETNTRLLLYNPFGQVLHQASDLCERRRRGLRHAGASMTAPNSGNNNAIKASAGRRSIQSNSLLRCSFWAAAAAVAVVLPSLSPAEARDTFTVSAGYQHSCIVTNDASVKVRGSKHSGGVRCVCVYLVALDERGALCSREQFFF